MSEVRKPSIFLICTGLGTVHRGFETYIAQLADNLIASQPQFGLKVLAGNTYKGRFFSAVHIPNISRNNKWSMRVVKSVSQRFLIEQLSFFFFLLPYLLFKPPAGIYLGEYRLYCYLFKIRKFLNLKYSLVLYTGGQAMPGLFDPNKDFVHHITNVYLDECKHLPKSRQYLVPHFINTDFEYNEELMQRIRKQSNGKTIVLSVGLLDNTIKRMSYLVESLIPIKEKVFPILLGEASEETSSLKKMLYENFGENGFIIKKVERKELGTWYKASDLFVLCSPKESFGLAMVEALYHDLPVFCDDFAEARFVLKNFGEFVKMNSQDALTKALKTWIQQDHSQNFNNARRQFAENNYSWQALQAKYIEMFNSFSGIKNFRAVAG